MNLNPYEPPAATEPPPEEAGGKSIRSGRGPAWYITFAGLVGAFASVPFVGLPKEIGLAVIPVMIFVGCVVGGGVFRVRSRHWPHDPGVRTRQIAYSLVAVALTPAPLFLLTGTTANWPAVIAIGAIVGVSVACGIFVSGTRRSGVSQTSP